MQKIISLKIYVEIECLKATGAFAITEKNSAFSKLNKTIVDTSNYL